MADPLNPPILRRRGRPRGSTTVSEPRTTLSAWIRVTDYDRLLRAANARAISVSRFVREILILQLR